MDRPNCFLKQIDEMMCSSHELSRSFVAVFNRETVKIKTGLHQKI